MWASIELRVALGVTTLQADSEVTGAPTQMSYLASLSRLLPSSCPTRDGSGLSYPALD